MYVIIGATGNTGKVVADRLLEEGKKVTVISRSKDHLSDLVAKGAISAEGNVEDSAFLKKTLQGAEGLYAMIPPKYDAKDFRAYQKQVGENISKAVAANDVPYVVTLSSFGAHHENGAGVVSGLFPFEQALNSLERTNVVHLRAGYFYENFLASIPVIRQEGVLGGFPIDGDVKLDMVHTSDIGNTAADFLISKDFKGNNTVLLSYGKPYTLKEATGILGKAINKEELPYVAFPAEGARQAMVGMGFSESLADQYVEFSQAASQGKLNDAHENLRKIDTETSLQDFAEIFARAYSNS